MKRLLLTAFEPFGGETINPSYEVARAIAQFPQEALSLQTLLLPVDRFKAVDMLIQQIQKQKPDVIIMLGEGGRRFRVTPERVAINIDDFRIADNAGNQPKGEPIVEGAPVGYLSTLPIYDIVEGLVKAKIPAVISNSAGTYLCNRVFYSVMHFLAEAKLPTRAGFIHLPYMHEQTIEKPVDFPSLSKETLIEAVRIAIERSAGD